MGCEWGPFAPVFGLVVGGCLLAGTESGRWSLRRFGRRSRAYGGLGGGCVVIVLVGSGLLLPPGCVSSCVWVFHSLIFLRSSISCAFSGGGAVALISDK